MRQKTQAGYAALVVLRTVQVDRARLDKTEAMVVEEARLNGASWADIGAATGMHRQNAWRKWGMTDAC